MKVLIVVNIPDKHLLKTFNDLYNKLQGYECELIPVPQKEIIESNDFEWRYYAQGWNACIDEITGEKE